jgi:hypothetical protein
MNSARFSEILSATSSAEETGTLPFVCEETGTLPFVCSSASAFLLLPTKIFPDRHYLLMPIHPSLSSLWDVAHSGICPRIADVGFPQNR